MDFQKNCGNEIHIPCMLKTDLQLGLSIFSSNSTLKFIEFVKLKVNRSLTK